MIFEANYQFRIRKKGAWLRGKRNNDGGIPTDIAEIVDVMFISNKLSYCVHYENGRVGYIALEELQYCEIFALETKIDKETIVSL